MTQFRDEWSIRLLDKLGLTFFQAPSSNPPDSWLNGPTFMNHPWKNHEEADAHLEERNRFAYEMAQAVLQTERPPPHLRRPWNELCRYLQEQVIDSGHFGAEITRESDRLSSRQETEPVQQPTDDRGDPQWNEDTDHQETAAESQEELLDDDQAHEELAFGVTEQEARVLNLPEEVEKRAAHASPSLFTFAFSQAKNKKTSPSEYGRDEMYEYQQDLDLYSKHTRSFLAFGWKTGKHHSAACISLKRRLRDSEEPWRSIAAECTENHGTKARSGDMQLYATCRDMPITKGYYVWKGECGGKFPTHYCNDDTALQIRHAHGIYDDGSKCLKRKRTH